MLHNILEEASNFVIRSFDSIENAPLVSCRIRGGNIITTDQLTYLVRVAKCFKYDTSPLKLKIKIQECQTLMQSLVSQSNGAQYKV